LYAIEISPETVAITDQREVLPHVAIADRPTDLVSEARDQVDNGARADAHPQRRGSDLFEAARPFPVVALPDAVNAGAARVSQHRPSIAVRVLRHEPHRHRVVVMDELAYGHGQLGVPAVAESQRALRHFASPSTARRRRRTRHGPR
jgi:hypothetical protein